MWGTEKLEVETKVGEFGERIASEKIERERWGKKIKFGDVPDIRYYPVMNLVSGRILYQGG